MSKSAEGQAFFSSNRNVSGNRYQLFQANLIANLGILDSPVNYFALKGPGQTAPPVEEEIQPATVVLAEDTASNIEEEPVPEVFETEISDQEAIKEEIIDSSVFEIADTLSQEVVVAEKPEIEEEIEVPVEEPVVVPQEVKTDYRVQFKASTKSLGKFKVTISGKEYTTFEYFYKGAYRYTIGSFPDARSAVELQNKCRGAGYKDAFIAAFRGDERAVNPRK